MYPKLAYKVHQHHVDPIYMGGARDGMQVPVDAAYHQLITNEFRSLHPYGKTILSAEERLRIAREVYRRVPLQPLE